MVLRDDEAQIFDLGFLKLTFVGMEVEFVVAESFQDQAAYLVVFFQCLHEDEDVIQVDADDTFHD